MAGGSQIFEIHVQREGRWTIDRTAEGQDDAESQARTLLRGKGITAVKVVREVVNGATSRETVVFEQTSQSGSAGRIAVGEIEEAPDCQTPEDLFALQGRSTINRLFRAYLDKTGITATEAMHDFRELKRAIDADTLMVSAIGKVATLQAKGREDLTVNQRRDELFGFVDQVLARAKEASDMKLPSIKKAGFEPTVVELLDSRGENGSYLARVCMTRELVQERNFFGKMLQTIDWIEPTGDTRALALSDGFLADTAANPTVIQDLMGLQPDLISALGSIVELSLGAYQAEDGGNDPQSPAAVAGRLNTLMAEGGFPDTRHVLIDRVCRGLDSKSPLIKGDPDKQVEAFRGFVTKVIDSSDDLVGGGAMAQALTTRQSRIINKGGLAGLKEATGRMLPMFSEPVQKASYLLSLKDSRIGQDLSD